MSNQPITLNPDKFECKKHSPIILNPTKSKHSTILKPAEIFIYNPFIVTTPQDLNDILLSKNKHRLRKEYPDGILLPEKCRMPFWALRPIRSQDERSHQPSRQRISRRPKQEPLELL